MAEPESLIRLGVTFWAGKGFIGPAGRAGVKLVERCGLAAKAASYGILGCATAMTSTQRRQAR